MRRFVVFTVLALALSGCGERDEVSSDGGAGPAATSAARGWEPLPDAPLSPRDQAVIAWTGREILVFGGTTFLCPPTAGCAAPAEDPALSDGAAYDPESREWRPIAPAPWAVPFARPVTVGGDVYVLATSTHDPDPSTSLLRYRPADDAWDAFEVPLEAPVWGLAASDRDVLVFHESDDEVEHPDLRFEPASERWSELPADPLSPSFDRQLVAVGDRLVLLAKDLSPSPGGADGPAFVEAAVLTDGVWDELPPADAIGHGPTAVVDDRVVLAALGCADGGATNGYGRCVPNGGVLDLATENWSPLPDPPTDSADAATVGVSTAAGVALWSLGNEFAGSWFLDTTAATWTTVPALDQPGDDTIVSRTVGGAGPYGVVFGGSRFGPGFADGELLGDAYLWRP